MGSPQRTIGAVIEIDLQDGHYTYGRILGGADFGIYAIHTVQRLRDIAQIISHPLLFIVATYNEAINSQRWKKIGKAPRPPSLETLPLKFIQDALHPDRFSLYDPVTGTITPASRLECQGLERAAVWSPEQVEERVRDHYAGRPNRHRAKDLAALD